MIPMRPWSATILVLTLLTVAAHLLATGPLRDSWWGVNMYAFLPNGWLVVMLALLGLVQALWSQPVANRVLGPAFSVPAPTRVRPPWQRAVWLLTLAVGGGLLLWLVRVRHLLLGDASTIVFDVPKGGAFLPREPLAGWFQLKVYALGQKIFGHDGPPEVDAAGIEVVVKKSLALSSVLAGAVFLPAAWLLAGELVPHRFWSDSGPSLRWRWPLFLILIGQGYLLLFCGYVEHYAFPTLGLTLYLWLSLRALRTGGRLILPAAALLLSVCIHLSAAVMAPSFLVLAGFRLAKAATRKRTLLELVLILLMVVAALGVMSVLNPGYNLLGTLYEITHFAVTSEDEQGPGYLLSGRHWRDFLTNQALIGPLGLFLFLPALVVAATRRRWRDVRWWFLAAAGLAYLVVSWLVGDQNLGYPRNWDLLATGGLVFVAAGLGLFFADRPDRRQVAPSVAVSALAALWIAVGLSWFHTAPWIALNTSFDRSFERFKVLPTINGLTETNVGRWYLMLGEREEGRRWLRRALEVAPGNNNAWYLLGQSLEYEGQADEAARAYVRAVRLRPYKVGYRVPLVRALVKSEQWSEAASAGRPLGTDPAAGPDDLIWYGLALYGAGERTEAGPILQRVYRATSDGDQVRPLAGQFFRYRGDTALAAGQWAQAAAAYHEALRWAAEPRDTWLNLTYSLLQAGDMQTAVSVASGALQRYPDWPEMLSNLGILLYELGRSDEARPYLERSLALDPEQEQAAQLRALLQQQS